MAFDKKTWEDRLTAFPSRRRLVKEDGTSELVTVSREEGEISQEGDAFSAANMNDLEERIAKGLESADGSKTMAYEEYLALPEETRKDGTTYYVPDAGAETTGDSVKDSNMYYDPANDTKYLKGLDGKWVPVGIGGLLAKYLYSGSANEAGFAGFAGGISGIMYPGDNIPEVMIGKEALVITAKGLSGCAISELVDFTEHSTLKFHHKSQGGNQDTSNVCFGITSNKASTMTAVSSKVLVGKGVFKEEDIEIDVSNLSGSYYVVFGVSTNSTTSVSKVRLV